ncbi:MAG TPA: hypothetical protein VN426_00010 [Syntrophomonadaceae bacterium]|nr:hypothetical protein [Syntrophomonadaceae bacterium]
MDIDKQNIPLVIQKLIIPIAAKGHLSNERRCYEEKRDWLGELEEISAKTALPDKFEISLGNINLRNWRRKISAEKYTNETLGCNLSSLISEVLKIPATWAYIRNVRLHYEW